MDIIILAAIAGIGYYFYSKSKQPKKIETKEPLFNLQKGATVDFYDNLLIDDIPLKEFNILENGPYEVTAVNRTSDTIEYSIKGADTKAVLEVEKRDGDNIILIQANLQRYPALLASLRNIWKQDIESFEFKGSKYFLVSDGEEVDGGAECYFWDYYSEMTKEGYKLFIGIQDYGEEGEPELEYYMGFELPERSIKDIIT